MIQTDIFLTEVYDFLKTVTIKNSYLADRKKIELESVLGIVIDDELDNPYYINLQGEYSSLDEMMYVTSIDTGLEIEFTKANLAINHKTYTTYRVPNEEFDDLVAKYPQQADLIKSILYPVNDIESAINAPNFTLLSSDTSLLEEQEVSSILDNLNMYLTMFRERWHIPAFYYEAYYPVAEWWMLWTLLPLIVLRQRVANLGTSKAHTSQIWEYLTSNGLGDYRSVLKFREQMFLYKNLRYLIQNRGKDSTLSILSENLLYPRNVALRSKAAMLDTTDSAEIVKPSAEFISRDIRDIRTPTQAIINGVESFDDLFEREVEYGLEPNLDALVMELQKEKLDHSKLSWLPTKLVEIQKLNRYDEFHELYVNMMVETILYRLSRNELDYNLVVPISESIAIPLSVQEAIALLFYTTGREYETSVLLTVSNIDNVVGKEIVLSDGTTVIVTAGNKNDYVGMIVEVLSPQTIPTTAHIVHAYKDEFPTIEQEFKYKNSIWRINRLIDYDDIFTRIETNVGTINTPDRLLELIDGHFKAMVTDINVKHALANTAYQMAYDLLYRQLLAAQTISLDFGIPHTTYHEWFTANQFLEDTIIALNNSSDVKAAYNYASGALLNAILPVTESTVTTFDQFTSKDFELTKQMFIQLCSYNIAFLDTEVTSDIWIRFAQITHHDKCICNYTGENIMDPDPYEINVTESVDHTTGVELKITPDSGPSTHQRLNNLANIFTRSSTGNSKPWTPKYETSKLAWFEADKIVNISHDNGSVTALQSSGSDGYILGQPNPIYTPLTGVRTLNGLNVIDSNNGFLETSNFMLPSDGNISIFLVAGIDIVTTFGQGIISMNASNDFQLYAGNNNAFYGIIQRGLSPNLSLTGGPFPGPSIYHIEYNKTETDTLSVYVDTVLRGSITYGNKLDITQYLRVLCGKNPVSRIDGFFAELLFVTNLNIDVKSKVEGYLAHKWGLADILANDHLYKLEPPRVPGITNSVRNNFITPVSRFDITSTITLSTLNN